jgi:uncharacterized cupin superfamily protein
VIPEAPLNDDGNGLKAAGDGWFVVNAREHEWRWAEGRTAVCDFEGTPDFPQLGINVSVLQPGEFMGMYHWEADQEDFLVLSGDALLVVEGEERPLKAWDFVHCPPGTNHIILGAGTGPCVVVAVGARDRSVTDDWGGYTADPVAAKHGVSVERDTSNADEAYAPFPRRERLRYRDGWLPG